MPQVVIDINHFIQKHKEHEYRRASANERQEYWKQYIEEKQKEDADK